MTALVLEAGGDEDQAVAALLHDAREDAPEREASKRRASGVPRQGATVLRRRAKSAAVAIGARGAIPGGVGTFPEVAGGVRGRRPVDAGGLVFGAIGGVVGLIAGGANETEEWEEVPLDPSPSPTLTLVPEVSVGRRGIALRWSSGL